MSQAAAQSLTALEQQPAVPICLDCVLQRLSLANVDVLPLLRELFADRTVPCR